MEQTTEVEEPLQTPAEEAGVPGENGKGLDGLAATVAAEHGAGPVDPGYGQAQAEPRKRGRPTTHGLYSKAMGSDGKHAAKAPGENQVEQSEAPPGAEPPPRVSVPPELLSKIVKQTLTLTENLAEGKISSVAKRAGLTAEEIDPQLEQVQLGNERKELVAELTPLVLKEHGLDAQVSPTVAVCFLLGPWSLSCVTAYMTLTKLAEEKLAMERKQKAA